jgi:hypothetical protein
MNLSEIEARSEKVTESGCWIWLKATTVAGYGVFNDRGKVKYAHREVYKEVYGEPLAGSHVLHTCDCRECVNPAHLYTGTNSQNQFDMMNRWRSKMRKQPRFFTPQEAQEIVLLREAGFTQDYIAKKFGATQSAISRLLSGKRS